MFKSESRIQLLIGLMLASLWVLPCFADSQVRIVRLSDVQGEVQVDRRTGQGFEKAFLNLPITQGMKIRTGNSGRAEIQFEDSSSLRIVPNTVIEIPQLSLRDSGAKVSEIHLQEGTAYVNFLASKDDELTVTFVREKLTLARAAHLRVDVGDTDAAVAVFKGDVDVAGPSETVQVGKNHTVSFDLLNNERHQLAKSVDEEPFDSWDKRQNEYDELYASKAQSNYSPYAYGTSDLNYYGNFFNAPGYGMLWQPYLAGAGWDPFMNGAWAFNPGFGYGWVSGYPWGWTPYHYGSWVYLPQYGWGWQPGGSWMGWNTVPVVTNAPSTFVPPRSPLLPGQRIIVANRGPLPTVQGKSSGRVEIPNNSAGLGIPRGSIKDLGQLSQTVQQRGFVTTRVPTTPAGFSGGQVGFGGANSRGSAPVWRGSNTSISAPPSAHASSGHVAGSGRH
ncbi:MAG: FecR family protein [Terriglobales bacterium]